MSNRTYLINLESTELKSFLFDCIDQALKLNQVPSLPANSTDTELYIDQKRVSELLDVSTVTIWDWEKKGILKSYRIGTLKRFKLSEVMQAPVPIKRAQAHANS